jgi:hypothetical protein
MIELTHDQLIFSFPRVHPDARLTVEFQRTLRIPPGEQDVPLLPGLGRYPLFPTADLAAKGRAPWLQRVDAMLPMYQSEAMWLSFQPAYSLTHEAFYRFALKIGVGHADAITGGTWSSKLRPQGRDFLVISEPSWLGGFAAGQRSYHQFVAVPFGADSDPTRRAVSDPRRNQVQLMVYPLRGEAFAQHFPKDAWRSRIDRRPDATTASRVTSGGAAGAQELERQDVHEDRFPASDWNLGAGSRYRVHLANSLQWCALAGGPPPAPAMTSKTRQLLWRNTGGKRLAASAQLPRRPV